MTPIAKHVFYTGRVQGVGFRQTTLDISRRFAVTGWVRNLPDRRVELWAEGNGPDVDAFLAAVRGHFANHIRDEATDAVAATGQFTTFEVR